MNDTSQTLTKEQLAERMSVTTRTVTQWMSSGRLAYCKIGRAVRITEQQWADFLKIHTVKALS